ncbi:hypothetical protein ACHAPT_010740 [Fusarium lateritium]
MAPFTSQTPSPNPGRNTTLTPAFRKIHSPCPTLTSRQDIPPESQTIAVSVIFGLVICIFLFAFIMTCSPWRKSSGKTAYEPVDQEVPCEFEKDAEEWPRAVGACPPVPEPARLEEEILKLWEASREKCRHSSSQPMHLRDSMDLGDLENVDLKTPGREEYYDTEEDMAQMKWITQPVKGQGANYGLSD